MYRWMVVTLLSFAAALSVIDRYIIYIFIDQIKIDLSLSDTEIGLITGLYFSVVYAAFGFLLGRRADSANRRNLIVGAVFIWSAMTMAAGLARNWWTFFLARLGVAAAEAALTPASYSLLSDIFPKPMLPRAISLVYLGTAVAPGLAMVFGGALYAAFISASPVLADIGIFPWQAVLLTAGLIGLLFAAILHFILREPARQVRKETDELISDGDFIRWFWSHRAAYWPILGGITALSCNFVAILTWISVFFQRSHGWTPGEAGTLLGIPLALCGALGAIVGGSAARLRSQTKGQDATLAVVLLFASLSAPAAILATSMRSANVSAVLICTAFVCYMAAFAVTPAYIQSSVPNRMRGRMAALYMVLLTLLAPSLGAFSVGFLTDYLFGDPLRIGASIGLVSIIFSLVALPLCYIAFARNRIAGPSRDGPLSRPRV